MKTLVNNQKYIVSILVTILTILGTNLLCYADVTSVTDRTPQVRDAIVAAIQGVDAATEVTETHLTTITSLNLRGKSISALETGDFSGLTALTNLNLYNNQLSSLPDGIFEGLTSLTTVRLGRNAVDPLPFTVSLEKVADGQFKAVAPAGALFKIVLPITVTNGTINSGATTLTIPHGSVESGTLTVTRTTGTTADVNVDIGTLPTLPRNHYGYALVKSDALPLAIISGTNTAPVFTDGASTTRSIPENTATAQNIGTPIAATDAENDTLSYTLSGTDAAAFSIVSTSGQLQTKAALDYETKSSYTVTVTVSDGNLTGTITVTIDITDVDEVVTVDPPITPDPPTTNVAPTFVEGENTIRVVLENIETGVNIGNPITATDADNDSLAYTLGGTDADAFDLNDDGQLKTKAPLDYETKRVYRVTITVNDEELSNTISVIIIVIDVYDTVIGERVVSVADRTPAVRDAIVAAVPNVTDATNVTVAQVAAITSLNLRNKGITKLKTGDFSGMTALTNLNLFGNQLRSLPIGIFDGLTALTSLRLGGNVFDPLPLVASLHQVGDGQFKAVISAGAPFNIVLPINVTNGSIRSGTTTVRIPQGSAESETFTVISTGTATPKVAFGTFPKLPRNHFGYVLAQSTVCNRTEQVVAAIAKALSVSDCSTVTDVELATITNLDLSGSSITSLNAGDFDGMFFLKKLNLSNNDLTSLPDKVFYDIVSLDELLLNSNKLTTIPSGIFRNLISLKNLNLQSNDLSSLPGDAFDGLSSLMSLSLTDNELANLSGNTFSGLMSLTSLKLSNNNLTSIPNGIFEGLTQLSQLLMSSNPDSEGQLSLTITLQKVGTNQFKVVVPSGVPFEMTIPINVTNGTLAGGANAISIPIGNVESQPITVSRTAGTVAAVTADIGTPLPSLPSTHNGYALAKATTLPLEVLPPINATPVFKDGANTVRTITENTTAGTNIGDPVAATDQDANDTLTYTLGGTNAASFDIDSTTGQLQTKTALDFETKNSYTVTLTVSDGMATDTIDVTINVTNVNEAPAFATGSTTTHIVAENIQPGVNIGSAYSATDVDGDTLTFSLSGTDESAFSIESSTGQLKSKAALDYETKTSYSVTIVVSDGDITATIDVTINVSNVDETDADVDEASTNSSPMFTDGTSTTRSVSEDAAIGSDIGTLIAATDADGHTLTYSLGGTDASTFSIDSNTGQLRTSTALDYETKQTYQVTVTVTDGELTDSINVTIEITDVDETGVVETDGQTDGDDTDDQTDGDDTDDQTDGDDTDDQTDGDDTDDQTDGDDTVSNNAPVFAEGSNTTRSVQENTGSGVDIGSAISATDSDDDVLTYTLGGTDAASFSIVSTSGQLQTNAALDYETKNTYDVTVSVSDGNGGSDSINVTINVTDVDETPSAPQIVNSAPVFTEGDSTTRTIAENTVANTNIGTAVAAIDANGDTLTYTLNGTDAASFSIVSTSGQLQTNAVLDYETKNVYTVTVSVSDSKGGMDSITVTINVTDVGGVDPPVSIRTQQVRDAIVAAVPDVDSADNVTEAHLAAITSLDISDENVTSLIAGDFAGLTALTTLYLSGNSFSDISPLAHLTSLTNLHLSDNSFSDISPLEDLTSLTTLYLADNSISDVSALEDLTSLIYLYLESNSISDVSALEDLTSLRILNLSGNPISDYGPLRRLKAANPNIIIDIDIDNNLPVFADGDTATRSIAENTLRGTNIGTPISAMDADTDDTLTYSLGGTDKDSFSIVSTSGQLQVSAALDYETKTSYSVTVSVSDGNDGTDSITVTINVTDVTESPINPAISQRTQQVRDAIVEAVPDVDNADNVTISDLAAITSLTLSAKEITSLKTGDFNGLTSLTTLYLTGNSISDISPLATLTTLTTLYLSDNSISDISPLDDLTSLTTLYLSSNSISNVSALEDLTALATLDLSSNSISNVSALEDLTALRSLYLLGNPISDYEPLRRLKAAIETAGNTIEMDINNVAPEFTEGDSTTRSIEENTVSGTNIGAPIAATNVGTFNLTYSLGGTDAASFSIVSTSGQLQTNAPIDYEEKASYTVIVSVSNGNNGSDSITVTINITDIVNEPIRPVNQRTQGVQDAIVAAVPNVFSADDVTEAHLTAITELDISNKRIRSLKVNDFEGLTSLTTLNLSGNSISDISPFTGLTTLTNLDLELNSISDISELDDLTSLTSLNLRGNSISDISVLDDLTALTTLNLGNNDIENISALSGLTSLTTLRLWSNSISDISALSGLTSLTTLLLSDNDIESISALSGLTSLTELSLSANSISVVSALSGLTALTSLSLRGNSVSDISALSGLTSLTSLNLSGNSISGISSLEDMTSLTTLDLSENSVSDVSVLEDLTSLTRLLLNRNSISDISKLAKLTSLTSLWLQSNSISNISVVAGMTKLETLYMSYNEITNVSSVEGLTALKRLIVGNNPIADYDPLRKLKAANSDVDIDINLNNNPPVFSDGDSTTRSVAENTAAGTNIGDAIVATDKDSNDTLTYRLRGADADTFSIVSTSGQLQTKEPLDYETQTSYTVTVDVSDGNDGLDRITVTINVTDVQGAAPSAVTPRVIPENTDLLTNYPNPFNPETWIPYQLAKPAEVTLTIYDMRGAVVRTIALGHQAAGMYTSRARAIHWDGRNSIGEKVATGVYFYTLTAGDYTATRKMLIRK